MIESLPTFILNPRFSPKHTIDDLINSSFLQEHPHRPIKHSFLVPYAKKSGPLERRRHCRVTRGLVDQHISLLLCYPYLYRHVK
jgi:hypothetical protein